MVLFPASASSLNCKSFGGSSTCNQSIIFMFRPHSESIIITFRQQQHLQSNKLSSKAAAPPFNQFHISVAAKPCNQSTSHFGGCKTLQSINFTFWRLQHLQSINFTFWRLQHLQSIIFTFRRLQHLQSINFTFRRQQHLQTAVNQFIFKLAAKICQFIGGKSTWKWVETVNLFSNFYLHIYMEQTKNITNISLMWPDKTLSNMVNFQLVNSRWTDLIGQLKIEEKYS